MIAQPDETYASHRADDEISLFVIGSVLLRRRRTIIATALVGTAVGLLLGLTGRRVYTADVSFIPQESEVREQSALELAVSQSGFRVPASGGGPWRAPMYLELLRSRALLEPIALDTVAVAEEGGRRVAMTDLLGIEGESHAHRTEIAVRELREITSSEASDLGVVKLSVSTSYPSVSLFLVERLVEGVNRFNTKTRNSQASAERIFVEQQTAEAGRALRTSEDRLQTFLQQNRAIAGSPELTLALERLEREMALHQELYTSWLKSREDAKVREVRDLPVITILERPRMPVLPVPRRPLLKAVLGGIAGGTLGVLLAFVGQAFAAARAAGTLDADEFFQLLGDAMPRSIMSRRRR